MIFFMANKVSDVSRLPYMTILRSLLPDPRPCFAAFHKHQVSAFFAMYLEFLSKKYKHFVQIYFCNDLTAQHLTQFLICF